MKEILELLPKIISFEFENGDIEYYLVIWCGFGSVSYWNPDFGYLIEVEVKNGDYTQALNKLYQGCKSKGYIK